MHSIKIISIGSYVPQNVVTNDDLSKIVETNDEWISSRTGIKKRRISTGENTSDLGAKAAINALNKANLTPLDIDILIVATISPDALMPSTACIVQGKIGAKNAVAFDVVAACSGFVFGINTASNYLKCGDGKRALIIGSEVLSKTLNWEDRSTCVLFGDGAGAVIIEATEEENSILATCIGSDGSQGECLTSEYVAMNSPFIEEKKETENHIKMNGRDVFKFAVTIIPKSVEEVLSKAKVSIDEIKYIVPHQANIRIVESAAKKLKVDIDKFYVNLEDYGNTSSASIPIALDEMNEKGLLKKGDKIIIVGFGGGLTWGAMLIQW